MLASVPGYEEQAKTLDELLDGSDGARTTAQRAVRRLVGDGALTQIGTGKKGNPFRYFYRKRFLPKRQIYWGRKNSRTLEAASLLFVSRDGLYSVEPICGTVLQ
jgi:hypothetical protein